MCHTCILKFFFFKQKPAYELRISHWSSDVCSSDPRGVQRRERFRIEPAACDTPARACDVIAHGSIDREDYGMDRWRIAVRDDVRYQLRLRLRGRSEEHTSELQSLMRISYAVFCLKKKKNNM